MANISVADELEKACELRELGVISQQQFAAFMAKLLASSAPARVFPVISVSKRKRDWGG